MPIELIIKESMYFSQGDEKSFFDRLYSLSCITKIKGAPDGLHITLSRIPSDTQLREMIATLHRYRLNMSPLAVLKTAKNAKWFSDPQKFWHANVFGRSKKS